MACFQEMPLLVSENASWFGIKNSLNLMTKTIISMKNMLCCYNWYLILCLLLLMLNMEQLLMMVFWLYNILECSFKFICKLAFALCLNLRNPWNILPGTFNVCTKCYSQQFKWTYSYCIWILPKFLPQYRIHLQLGYIPKHAHREHPRSLKII